MQTRMDNVAHGLQRSMRLASLAREALIAEAELTPKPALVDRRGSGAHHDLSLALMRQSATAIEPYFAAMASCSQGHNVDGNLRSQLASIGRSAERAMYQATQGSNAHKGAIWILGLLVSAAIRVPGENAREIVAVAGAIARLPDREQPKLLTHGDMVRHRYGAGGARMEASTNYPHVMKYGLPVLRDRRARKYPEEICRLDALLSLMAELDDTCVLYRGGVEALSVVKAGAQAALDAGGYANANGRRRLRALDRELIARNVSPGGSADLLAATIFLDALDLQASPLPLSSRAIMGLRPTYEDENSFYSATSLPGSAASPFVHRATMCLRPPMRMKMVSIQQPLSPEALPPLCPPSDHGSAATYEDENGFNSATSLSGSAALPFVISTGAQRSGEISVLMPLLGNVFRRSEAVPQTCPGNVF